jgi:hypothetical protein
VVKIEDMRADRVEKFSGLPKNWEVIKKILPTGWEDAARVTNALRRTRGFEGPEALLRALLIHLADGCSLRETAVRAAANNLADVSDVALLNRLHGCGEWFRWMTEKISEKMSDSRESVLPEKRVLLVDASAVCEPGATGSTWRLHYMIDRATLRCEQALVTLPNHGRTLMRFEVQPNDILMGDGNMAHRRGLSHVVSRGGDVVLRMNLVNAPLITVESPIQIFDQLSCLHEMAIGQTQGWKTEICDDRGGVIPIQVCALKRSEEQTRKVQESLRQDANIKKYKLKPELLEAAGYLIILTTLYEVDPATIVDLYHYSLQNELVFGRLKSLLQLGHLKKIDHEGAKAWLQGKVFVAILIEMLNASGECSSR